MFRVGVVVGLVLNARLLFLLLQVSSLSRLQAYAALLSSSLKAPPAPATAALPRLAVAFVTAQLQVRVAGGLAAGFSLVCSNACFVFGWVYRDAQYLMSG